MHDGPGETSTSTRRRPGIEAWRQAVGTYWGLGDGPESGRFTGRVTVTDQVDAVALTYEAWSPEQSLQHRERAVIIQTPADLQLVTVISEVPGHLAFRHDGDRYNLIRPGPYAMAVDLGVADGRLTWAWFWAPLGDTPVLQSWLDATRVS